jgi:predicted metal-dependent enzyme (double-stranded beta helix superfamily)
MSTQAGARVDELIRLLDEAVDIADECARCHRIKDILHDITASGEDFVPAQYLKPADGCYARHLLHKDPAERYSVLVMVWDKGQGTAVHDHAGCWCVECVYRGRIKVVSYDLESNEGDLYHFKKEQEIYAGISDAGALIPPFEYHTIENTEETPSVTIHVYAGELTWCHIFVPEGDAYRRVRRELCYTAND